MPKGTAIRERPRDEARLIMSFGADRRRSELAPPLWSANAASNESKRAGFQIQTNFRIDQSFILDLIDRELFLDVELHEDRLVVFCKNASLI
jgi:hypothetical protein